MILVLLHVNSEMTCTNFFTIFTVPFRVPSIFVVILPCSTYLTSNPYTLCTIFDMWLLDLLNKTTLKKNVDFFFVLSIIVFLAERCPCTCICFILIPRHWRIHGREAYGNLFKSLGFLKKSGWGLVSRFGIGPLLREILDPPQNPCKTDLSQPKFFHSK